MGRRARDDSADVKNERSLKHLKLLRDGLDYEGEDWSWRTFLEKLHFFLDSETEGDALAWLDDGTRFLVQQSSEVSLAQWLGLRVCSLRQALEALNFECFEESHWDFTVYRHNCFVLGDPSKIEQILAHDISLSTDRDMVMPSVAYSSALKPLEVRLSVPDSHSQSWAVTIAPSVLPHPTFDATEVFQFGESVDFGSSVEELSRGEMFDTSNDWSDHGMNSPLWWSQRSDFSSICTDDLSDMDSLSQECLSPKGTIKKKKQERKAKERQAQEICNLNVLIGRLEDRDTQQQAFATLIESLPGLDSSLVKEFYTLIEKNKKPGRSSTRRMLVLLIAALCRCQPVKSAKLLPRILSYTCLRLRDRHAKTTDACVILMSAVALYVLPCPTVSLLRDEGPSNRGDSSNPFEAVAAMLARETNAVGEAATRCLCGLLHPVDFDGISVPSSSTILAHATRIRSFFKTLVADTVAKVDGSTMFAAFSPSFLLLQSACQLARDAHEKANFTQLGNDFAPYIGSIYEAIEDVFQCSPRSEWMLRKRGLELLTMMLDIFVLQESDWFTSAEATKEYFQLNLERVRTLVLAGRHDSASLVREAAIPAALAFDCLEKIYPRLVDEVRSNVNPNYDFVPPNPPGYSFTSKQWAKPVDDGTNDVKESLPADATEEDEDVLNFNNQEEGDEALPSHDDITTENDDLAQLKRQSTIRKNREKTSAEDSQGDERFTDLIMDHAAPENGGEDEHLPSEHDKSSFDQPTKMRSNSSRVRKVALEASAAEQVGIPTRPISTATRESFTAEQVKTPAPSFSTLSDAMHAVTTLKEFAAKQRAQARLRRTSQQDIPQISLPKRRPPRAIDPPEGLRQPQPNNELRSVNKRDNNNATDLELTRGEAALEAAQCGEYELAFRLCIVEDDLELLQRTMSMIKTPCMMQLSSVACNALCTAFLSLLDGDEANNSSDVWLALQWLQQWAAEVRTDRQQFERLDPRVIQALGTKLHEMATAPTKSALAAAHVLFLLGV